MTQGRPLVSPISAGADGRSSGAAAWAGRGAWPGCYPAQCGQFLTAPLRLSRSLSTRCCRPAHKSIRTARGKFLQVAQPGSARQPKDTCACCDIPAPDRSSCFVVLAILLHWATYARPFARSAPARCLANRRMLTSYAALGVAQQNAGRGLATMSERPLVRVDLRAVQVLSDPGHRMGESAARGQTSLQKDRPVSATLWNRRILPIST